MVGAVIVAVVSAAAASDSNRKARHAQQDAERRARALQEKRLAEQKADQEPWRASGLSALEKLNDFTKNAHTFTMADYEADPGYAFRLGEGQKALERGADARGILNSGRGLKEITRYGQDFASNEYQNAYNRYSNDQTNRFNRLASIAGIGQLATNTLGGYRQGATNAETEGMYGLGNSVAASHIAQGNIYSNFLSQMGNTYMQGGYGGNNSPSYNGGNYGNYGNTGAHFTDSQNSEWSYNK